MLLPPMAVRGIDREMMKMETWLRNNEHTIKTLGILSAAIFTLFQYFGHINENRVQQTLELYKEFSSEPLISARNGLLKEVEEHQNFLKYIPNERPSESEANQLKMKWAKYIVNRIDSNVALMVQVNNMFDFFDALQICVENNICDKKSAQDLLGISAKELTGNFCPYIAYMRYDKTNRNEQFATKSNAFSGNTCMAEIYKQIFHAT